MELTRFGKYLDSISIKLSVSNELEAVEEVSTELVNIVRDFEFCSESKLLRLQLGLIEIMANAVEHGNLEIGGETKARLLEQFDDSYSNLIEERRNQAPYKNRKIRIEFSLVNDKAIFVITDEGPGFDHKKYHCKTNTSNDKTYSGRGIQLTSINYVDEINYNQKGNQVTIIKKCEKMRHR